MSGNLSFLLLRGRAQSQGWIQALWPRRAFSCHEGCRRGDWLRGQN